MPDFTYSINFGGRGVGPVLSALQFCYRGWDASKHLFLKLIAKEGTNSSSLDMDVIDISSSDEDDIEVGHIEPHVKSLNDAGSDWQLNHSRDLLGHHVHDTEFQRNIKLYSDENSSPTQQSINKMPMKETSDANFGNALQKNERETNMRSDEEPILVSQFKEHKQVDPLSDSDLDLDDMFDDEWEIASKPSSPQTPRRSLPSSLQSMPKPIPNLGLGSHTGGHLLPQLKKHIQVGLDSGLKLNSDDNVADIQGGEKKHLREDAQPSASEHTQKRTLPTVYPNYGSELYGNADVLWEGEAKPSTKHNPRTVPPFQPTTYLASASEMKFDDNVTSKWGSQAKLSTEHDQKRTLPPSLQPTNYKIVPKAFIKNSDVGLSTDFPGKLNHAVGGKTADHKFNTRDDFNWKNDDEVHIYENVGPHRHLPSWMNGGSSTGRYAASSTMSSLPPHPTNAEVPSGIEERSIENDERLIFQAALQDLAQPKFEMDLPDGLLAVSLLRHQKIALAWMVKKETTSLHCSGGILADDQGLGKTISTIALILMERPQQVKFTSNQLGEIRPETLNLDEVDNGLPEVDKITHHEEDAKTSSQVKLLSNHPDDTKPEPLNLVEIDDELPKVEKNHLKTMPVGSTSMATSHKGRPAAGTLIVCPASVLRQWSRELDEKVTESNELSVLIYHGSTRTKCPSDLAKYDVVLTTYTIVANEVPKQPLVDDDDDDEQRNAERYGLCSEFSTIRKRKKASDADKKRKKKKKEARGSHFDYDSGPLARVRWFRVVLDEAQTIKNYRTQVSRACCGLRAKKRWCLSGTPLQNSLDDLYSYFRFLKYDPYSVYKSFCFSIKFPISRNATTGYKKLQAVLRTIMLRRTKGTLIDGEPIIKLPPKLIGMKKIDFSPEERSFYSALEADSRKKFKAYAAAGTVNQNYASILLLLLRLRQACDHRNLVKEYYSGSAAEASIKMAKQLSREMLIKLLNQLEASLAICGVCSDPPEDAVVTMCGHVFCFQCVSERLTGDDNLCPAAGCKDMVGTDSVFSGSTLKSCLSDGHNDNAIITANSPGAAEESALGLGSSKIAAAMEILDTICLANNESPPSNSPPELPVKALVFSQWTSMLDLLEIPLNNSLIQYRRLDGTMSLAARDKAVKDFNTDPEVSVIIMSLKAGNLGLNMIAACHVILLDPWWNPTTEDQAIDRAHRIGQTRPVNVARLTIKETVEDRILELQIKKREMVSSAFGEDQTVGRTTRLTVDDLRFLFLA